jgi:hypothetical protein
MAEPLTTEVKPGPATPVSVSNQPAIVPAVPYWSYWVVPIAVAFFGCVQVISLAVINSNQNVMATDVAATAVSVEKAHVAINSERTAMQNELKKMNEIILDLSKKIAREDQKRLDKK